MDLIDFIKENHRYLNLGRIEDDLKLPATCLKAIVYKNRRLKQEYADAIIKLFDFIDLSYSHVDLRFKSRVFDTTGWDNTFGRYWEKGDMTVELDKCGYWVRDLD